MNRNTLIALVTIFTLFGCQSLDEKSISKRWKEKTKGALLTQVEHQMKQRGSYTTSQKCSIPSFGMEQPLKKVRTETADEDLTADEDFESQSARQAFERGISLGDGGILGNLGSPGSLTSGSNVCIEQAIKDRIQAIEWLRFQIIKQYLTVILSAESQFDQSVGIMVMLHDSNGDIPLHSFVENYSDSNDNNDLSIIKFIADKVPQSIRVQNINGETALHHAAYYGKLAIVQILVNQDYGVTMIQDNEGNTALHYAAYNCHLDIVLSLLAFLRKEEKFRLVNMRNNQGYTALHFAVFQKQREIIQLLIEINSDLVNIPDNGGMTPVDYADEEMKKILTNGSKKPLVAQ